VVSIGDPLSQSNPALFCNDCFRRLHYTQDGQLLRSDFVVFPYLHE
jgi:hypothetical protein